MTRETKIGLLVGLAFIIVIGILLSDHMTSTTEPNKAALSVAGGNVRQSVAAPAGGALGQPAAAVAAGAGAQPASAPGQPVLTQQEVAAPPQRPVVQNIQVGPAAGPSQPQPQAPITIQQTAQPPVVVSQAPAAQQPPGVATEPPVTFVPPAQQRRGATHPLQSIANKFGEDVVVFGDPTSAGGAPVPMAPVRQYKAEPGDSLSRMASKLLGSASKVNQEAIVRANPSLQSNPNKIVAGRVYQIPPAPAPVVETAAVAPPGTTVAAPEQAAGAAPLPAPAPAPAAPTGNENFNWYTVKENDNLWKIAADQLGSGNAWTQIRDLNPDVLKGSDRVTPNMRIRVPRQQPVASAS